VSEEGRKLEAMPGADDMLLLAQRRLHERRARLGREAEAVPRETVPTPAPSRRGARRGPPPNPLHTRFDHSLAEFPAFRFGRRRRTATDLITFEDSIKGSDGAPLSRRWTVYPSRFGYGGATTLSLLFELNQVWKGQGFRGNRIHFGTLRSLYRRLYSGRVPGPRDYAQLRRDLSILCGYKFSCENSFWDPVSGSYGSMRDWSLFTAWFEAHRAGASPEQEEFPFGFIEVSDTFAKVAAERGFFVTGFEAAWFHALRPIEQRLSLYLSKMFASQELHRRFEEDLFAALPIEGTSTRKKRQTLRAAAASLIEKGYPPLSSFTLEPGASGRFIATFRRKAPIAQDYPLEAPVVRGLDDATRLLLDDVLEVTRDVGSTHFYLAAIRALGHEPMRFALSDLRAECHQRSIKNRGAWLTTKLMAMAEERGVRIGRHRAKDLTARRPQVP